MIGRVFGERKLEFTPAQSAHGKRQTAPRAFTPFAKVAVGTLPKNPQRANRSQTLDESIGQALGIGVVGQ